MYRLGFLVLLFTLDDVFGGDTTLGQIDVTFFFVHTKNDHDVVLADTDQLLDGPYTSTGQFAQQDHPLDVVVLQQFDVGTHLGDLLDVDHDDVIDLRVLVLVKSAMGDRHDALALLSRPDISTQVL